MGVENMGGGGEYWRSPQPERNIESPKSPEAAFEREPRLHRRLKAKNKLVSQLYQYASGGTHASPVSSISTPQEAMDSYLKLTGGNAAAVPSAPLPPSTPLPPTKEILAYDPYSVDPFRLTAADRQAANLLAIRIRRKDAKTVPLSSVLDIALSKFIRDFSGLGAVSATDKADVAGRLKVSGVRSFRESLEFLLSRYIALKSKGKSVTEEDLKTVLESGFHAYAQTFFTDIPYYDKVFEWFDSVRKNGRHPQEVYLGRDGMYASLGRRSQDLSKRRKAGLEKRLATRKAGKPIEIKPKYLIYPRFYRDQLTKVTKEHYLKSQGISADSDPVFFDTGFTGTVPEQILDILGVAKEGRDDRIKMLSAGVDARRVPGIPPTERRKIVDAIEYNMKPEDPSSGIMIDKMGRLKHVAKPTSPEEQFIFGIIRLAIVRHYWIAERTAK